MYIAMNHFRVKPDREADFEKAWRERESFLAEVPGFEAFQLLKGPLEKSEDQEVRLYASHTTWKDEAAFLAWTESDAFKKAHGQGRKTVEYLVGPPRFVGWSAVPM
jgi:heme-degrading monooxygenase HmoA